jgi:prevent-host-death family protein
MAVDCRCLTKLVNLEDDVFMETVNTYEAKAHLSRLIERAAAGEQIIIARAGKPVARLVAYTQPAGRRTGGHWKGRISISDDFDAPLPPQVAGPFDGLER